ncbi:MAG: glycosyltransferase, partial [Chitinophagaceae bacterium]
MPDFELKKKTILVAPLDWGLGHATRCIPLIKELLNLNCNVLIGAEGQQAALLNQEFPDLPILPLPGYRVKYNHGNSGYVLKMVLQLPKISKAVRREKRWLKQMVTTYSIDAVIADNRFGLHHPHIPSIIMTHQLH